MPPEAIRLPGEGRIPALDGIRGLAILLVIAFHCRVAFSSTQEIPLPLLRVLDLGWSGVDLFFVLSGFLITGILLDSRESASYFRTFYARRVLRIFPLYFAYLFLVLVVFRYAWIRYSGTDLWRSTNPWWYFCYLLNWKPDHGYNDLYLGHLWSLAIEEQFYLVWPLVVWICPRRRLAAVCLSLAGCALAARCLMGAWHLPAETVYRLTPSRMDTLALGALVAVGMREFPALLRRWAPRVCALAGVGLAAVLSRQTAGFWEDAGMRTAGASLVAVLYAGMVYATAASGRGMAQRVFSSATLRRCGKYSYAMYVLHSFPYHITAEAVRGLSASGPLGAMALVIKWLYLPAMAAVAFGGAWLSWRTLEQPFLRLKRKFPYMAEHRVCKLPEPGPEPAGYAPEWAP
jgi:peptidoglycan/LPS O-acetylase OafA/YrhL